MNEVTTAQMKELERLADAAGLPYLRMMENAGTAAARELMARVPGLKAAAVFCGRGNNGGDGLVAARRLQDAGVEVIAVLAEGEPATPDAAANREAAQDRGVHIQTLDGLTLRDEVFIARADALVDAVYDTGETAEGAVRAHVTVAFHAPKPCHRLAAEQCGTVVTADIGIGAALGEE